MSFSAVKRGFAARDKPAAKLTRRAAWLTFFAFLGLKLSGAITWSWWWVTAPLWASTALGLSIAVLVIALAFLVRVFLD